MKQELLKLLIEELDEEHLRQLVRQYANTDRGPEEILKAVADQEQF